jgi:hypothetical protein
VGLDNIPLIPAVWKVVNNVLGGRMRGSHSFPVSIQNHGSLIFTNTEKHFKVF